MSFDFASLVPDYCDVFLGLVDIEEGIAFPNALNRSALDFTVDSLVHLDHYLNVVYDHGAELDDQTWTNTVLAAGAYLGEVIRRNALVEYNWVNYHDYFALYPENQDMFPEMPGTVAVLTAQPGTMTLPLNKIARFIEEGPENNTHFYASAEIKSAVE